MPGVCPGGDVEVSNWSAHNNIQTPSWASHNPGHKPWNSLCKWAPPSPFQCCFWKPKCFTLVNINIELGSGVFQGIVASVVGIFIGSITSRCLGNEPPPPLPKRLLWEEQRPVSRKRRRSSVGIFIVTHVKKVLQDWSDVLLWINAEAISMLLLKYFAGILLPLEDICTVKELTPALGTAFE